MIREISHIYQSDSESVARITSPEKFATLSEPKRCTKEEVAKRLVLARNALGLTQKTMAATTGMALPSLKDYEKGKSIPGGEALAAIYGAGVSVHWLLTGEGAMLLKDAGETAPPPAVDANTLMTVMEEVERALATRRLQLAPAKKARLVGVLYDYVKSSGNKESAAVERFLELMT